MAGIEYRPTSMRAIIAAERREQREAKKYLKELERRAKEQAKLSLLEQARLEVETYENRVALILSMHKEQSEPWDWSATVAALPPPCPQRLSTHESRARQLLAVAFDKEKKAAFKAGISEASTLDERIFRDSLAAYKTERLQWEQLHTISGRMLSGDYKAYEDALIACGPLEEVFELGSSCRFCAHSMGLIECALKVNGLQAIPNEIKTLTSTGKLSVKPMPKARFHEIYQDYVCGCMLRVAREVFAFLPASILLITASADLFDSSTGRTSEQPVVSAVIHRSIVNTLDIDRLDPSDAVESFQHRGDFKATRKSGAFQPIAPLSPSEIIQEQENVPDLEEALSRVRRLGAELQEECIELGLSPTRIAGHGHD